MKKTRKEPTKSQIKYKRRLRLKQKSKHKPKASLRDNQGRIIPVSKKCIDCGKKVKNHHFRCQKCHKENNGTKKR